MAEKVINGSTSNSNISSRMVCSSVPNIAGNYSAVTVTGRLSRTNTGYTTSGNGTFYLEVDGVEYKNTDYFEITYDSDTIVVTAEVKIEHNANGRKSVSVKFFGSMPDTSLTSISCSGTFTLDSIARIPDYDLSHEKIKAGNELTVTLSNTASSLKYNLVFVLGERTKTFKNVGLTTKWVVPKSWQDQFTDAPQGTMVLTVNTYTEEDDFLGRTGSNIIILPSDDAAPELNVDVSGVNLYWDLFIQTKSQAKIDITASAKYGAEITRYSISCSGYTSNKNTLTTGVLKKSGPVMITSTVTDSRGITSTTSGYIEVVPYAPPVIQYPQVYRTNEDGSLENVGTYIYAYAQIMFSGCNDNNTAQMTVRYKEQGGTYGAEEPLPGSTGTIIGNGTIETNKYYVVEIKISDEISSPVSQEFPVSTENFRAAFGTEAAGILTYPPAGGKGLYTTDINAKSGRFEGRVRFGLSASDTDSGVNTIWADGETHDIVTRGTTGISAYFGWIGSEEYPTITYIRGQTCRYQNASGSTTLSDERLKKDFTNLDKWKEFYAALDPVAFKMVNGRSGRYHLGFKAQQVEQALLNNGLTTQDFAGLVKMAHEPDPEDLEGKILYENAGINPGDDEYGLIYTEFVALNVYMIQKLLEKVDIMETEIKSLKEKAANA